ncbi:MAG: hypothetical protein P1U85_21245 [Verrucomicrobiales bacterium]|nr:hypothetical protein [Verrucomicrobiales bacterium]
MTTKLLKFQSEQAGPFDVSNNKVDIVLPSYIGYSDLSQSCIILNLKLKNKPTGNDLGIAIDQSFNDKLDATCLIKHCSLTSDTLGTIEDLQCVNVFNSNMNYYTMDFEDEKSAHTMGYGSQNEIGTFIRKNKSGSNNSTQETYLQIQLSKLFGIGRTKQFPNGLIGNCKIHLEFEDDVANIVPKLFKKRIDPTIYNITKVSNTSFTLPTRLQQAFNLYVGQSILMGDDDAFTNQVDSIIDSISFDSSTNLTTFTHTTPNTHPYIRLKAYDDSAITNANLTYEIQDVKLKVYQYLLSSKQQESLNSKMKKGINLGFSTYSLERVNLNDALGVSQTYDRQFDIEPNCYNVMALSPIQNTASYNPFWGRQDNLAKYRWRLNGIDTTDRDISPYKSLYNDRLMATLSSGQYKAKNLNLKRNDSTPVADVNIPKDSLLIIPQPIPLSNNNQVLQIRTVQGATASTANKTFHLFKQVQKAIKLGGQSMVVA